jgi:hypothetical protein
MAEGGRRKACLARFSMRFHGSTLQSWLYTAAGLTTAVAGKAALDDTGSSWPTILVVVGLFVAASGIRGISR